MIKDTPFNQAQEFFKQFLSKEGLPDGLLWLFREDVICERGRSLIKVPFPAKNKKLAEACCELGRIMGFGAGLHAFCLLGERVCCYIQLPEDDLDSQYKLMSELYVKYTVATPGKTGKEIKNPVLWHIRKWLDRKKRQASFIDDMPSKKTLLPVFEINRV